MSLRKEVGYGLISSVDANCLIKTIEFISAENTVQVINVTEVGIYAGETGNWLRHIIKYKQCKCFLTGVDNEKDGEVLRFSYDNLIIGNSNEVYNQIPDESQHLIFIDGLHTFAGVVSDFFCYAPKVKKGAYLAFHDTGKHINPLHGWQGVGDKNDPDFCLGGVSKALYTIGLPRKDWVSKIAEIDRTDWKLIFDEADPNDEAGGICVFKKLY